MTTENTAKRKLSEISFEQKGCHVSLVGPSLGGPANGVTTLVMKSLSTPSGDNKNPNGEGNNMTVEMIEKSAVDVMIQKAVSDATAVLKSELDTLKASQEAEKVAKRKAKLVAAVGETEAEGVMAVAKSLDDNAFEVILKSLSVAKGKEANSEMFTEKGVEGKTDTKAQMEQDSGVMKMLKSKYHTTA